MLQARLVELASCPLGRRPTAASAPRRKGRPRRALAEGSLLGLPLPPIALPPSLPTPAQASSSTDSESDQKKDSPPETAGSAVHRAESESSSLSSEAQNQLGESKASTPGSSDMDSSDAGQ